MPSMFKSKQLNLIIGVDTFNNCLRVMQIVGNDVSTCKVDYIPVDPDIIVRGDWENLFGETLKEYIDQLKFDKSFAVKLVLPDRLVGMDVFTVPTLSRAKMDDVLQTQMKELYFFYPNYKFNKLMLATNKTNSTFQVYMVNKDVLNGIYKSLSTVNRLYVKNASYSASCALNAVYALRPKTKKASFLFLDIKEMNSRISISGNGTTLGWVDIPFGLNVLENDKVLFENNVVYNDVANIAVINATEIARKKKMTVMGEDEEDDTSVIEDAAISVNDLNASEANFDGTSIVQGENGEEIVVQVENEGETALSVPTDVVVVEPEEVKPKKKTYARKVKRLPAFMQRPVPEDELGFMAENFRMFVKRVLLVKMHHEQNAHLVNPQFVLVNMPQEYAGILDIINQEEDNGIEFRYFNPDHENNRFLSGNLDLYGALFTESFNKQNNF